jgi:succinate dehydrogenase / fumarate reductase, cytochrome b subunit
VDTPSTSFLARNQFLLLRLHSLSGIIPVGAYMVIHLLTNASILDGPGKFQSAVYQIHSLGSALVVVEWVFIFIPLIYHAIFGLLITRESLPNSATYTYSSNIRYTLQRATGLIAFAFIFYHVFHMHGWFHADWWLQNVAQPLGGGQFKPYNASSTAGAALQGNFIIQLLYGIGLFASVFHLANGVWTFGITWGIWVSPKAQARANYLAIAVGVFVGLIGLGALVGMAKVDVTKAKEVEDKMYESRVSSGDIAESPHKRSHDAHAPAASGAQ